MIQGNTCWCSNYVPGSTVSGGRCNENCPGFPTEKCGSSTDGLFGYIALDKAPSGTRGGSGTSAVSSQPLSGSQMTPTPPSVPSTVYSSHFSVQLSPPVAVLPDPLSLSLSVLEVTVTKLHFSSRFSTSLVVSEPPTLSTLSSSPSTSPVLSLFSLPSVSVETRLRQIHLCLDGHR